MALVLPVGTTMKVLATFICIFLAFVIFFGCVAVVGPWLFSFNSFWVQALSVIVVAVAVAGSIFVGVNVPYLIWRKKK